jgi:hypothetical protein
MEFRVPGASGGFTARRFFDVVHPHQVFKQAARADRPWTSPMPCCERRTLTAVSHASQNIP